MWPISGPTGAILFVLLLVIFLRIAKWKWGISLAGLEKVSKAAIFIAVFDIVVGTVLIIQFLQSKGNLPQHLTIPIPPFSYVFLGVYFFLAFFPFIVRIPPLYFIRRYFDGQFGFSWRQFRFHGERLPPKDRLLAKSRLADFVKSITELGEAKLPLTEKIILDELRLKLLLVAESGNH